MKLPGRFLRRQRPATRRQGVVTVEFALVAPIIFLIFFGALDIASMNFARHASVVLTRPTH